MDIEIKEPHPGVFLIVTDTQYEISSLFLRMQEFYESPFEDIKGKYFTLEQYMDTYAADNGNFTYTTDWNGFNVPGYVVKDFYKLFNPAGHLTDRLLRKESDLFFALAKRLGDANPERWTNDFYLIGTHKAAGVNTMLHEIAHALYYLDADFRQLMKVQMHIHYARDKADNIVEIITGMGYHENVCWDEMQAYLSTSSWWEIISKFGLSNIQWHTVRTMRKIFREKTKWSDDI